MSSDITPVLRAIDDALALDLPGETRGAIAEIANAVLFYRDTVEGRTRAFGYVAVPEDERLLDALAEEMR